MPLPQLGHRKAVIIFAIAFITILTRFFLLGDLPGGIHQDEASMGYDAYALLEYGIDRNGSHNPVHMIAWGSGQNALLAYLSMPAIKLFGLNIYSIRLAPAILGCLCVYIMFLLGRRLVGTNFGLTLAAITAINSWHIMASRWALESNILPAFLLISIYFLIKATENKRLLPLSFIFFGLSLYAYAPSYLVIPLFLAASGLYYIKHKTFSLTQVAVSTSILIVIALPIFLFVIINTLKLPAFESEILSIPRYTGTPRYTHMSSVFGSNPISALLSNIARSFEVLFIQFNDGEYQNGIKNIGYIPQFFLPFFIIGLFSIIKTIRHSEKQNPWVIIIIWLTVSLLISFTSKPAIHRMNTTIFPILIIASYGIFCIANTSKVYKHALTLAITFSFFNFSYKYHNDYAHYISKKFFQGYNEAIIHAHENRIEGYFIYASSDRNQSYIGALFATKTSPYEYLETRHIRNPNGAFQRVQRFGQFKFGIQSKDVKSAPVIIVSQKEKIKFNLKEYYVYDFNNYATLYRKNFFQKNHNDELTRSIKPFTSYHLNSNKEHLVIRHSEHIAEHSNTFVAQDFFSSIVYELNTIHKEGLTTTLDVSHLTAGFYEVYIKKNPSSASQPIYKTPPIYVQRKDSTLVSQLEIKGKQSRDQLSFDKATSGHPLTTARILFEYGLGTHANSEYSLINQGWKELKIGMGLSDFSGGCGNGATFQIWGDDLLLIAKHLVSGEINVSTHDISNVQRITLKTLSNSNFRCDHTNWLGGLLTK